MGRRRKEESELLKKLILQAIESGARTMDQIRDDTGISLRMLHYYLVRKGGAAKDDTLVRQGLVRRVRRYVASEGEGKARQIYWHFYITDKGREFLSS